jgi:RecB family exonuclease
MRSVLTYSALNCFRNCPRRYKLRYIDLLRRPEQPESLAFGTVIHEALQRWYTLPADNHRLLGVLDFIDSQYPNRNADAKQKAAWQLARAIIMGYAERYAREEFEVLHVEKEFEAEIRNPETGRPSQTFTIAGKVDGIVRVGDEVYLLENKTASTLTGDYLDRLWTDTQIALYCFYLRQQGFPIVGVIYNVLLKARLQQRAGETDDEFEARRTALAAKNKSGKSTAKRQDPESDEEFTARLHEWYARAEAFHRERIYLSEDRLAMLQEEVWTITQQYLDARGRGKWLMNTSNCFSFQRPCEYLPYCQSGFNPNVRDNLFQVVPAHEELATVARADNPDSDF